MAPLLTLRRMPRRIIALGLALLLAAPAALAQGGDPIFTVGGVLIEASGADPNQARDKALAEGEKKAFELLMRRLVAEAELNRLGYQLLRSGHPKEAIEIFKLNVEAYPQGFNTYDSLAEAYMSINERELAQ